MSEQDKLDQQLGANIRRLVEYELSMDEGPLEIGRGQMAFLPLNQEADDLYYVDGRLVYCCGKGTTLDEAAQAAVAKLQANQDFLDGLRE